MGRPERPVDPHAGPVERLAWELRRLRNEAGRPSYRELARRAHFSRSTLAEAATGMRLPTLETTVAYAVACGGERVDWEARWAEAAAELERSRRRCPYPGLAPLRGDDADLFFGRDRLADDLDEAVRRGPFTAVFGASGSGKSSLLLAGLLPRLEARGTPSAVMTPGARPTAALEEALASLGEKGVLVVDQFEEAFTLCADDAERAAFLDALTALEGPTVVIGVRSDFYEHCSRHPGLVAALRENVQLPLGPVSAGELRAIVVEPAARVGLSVEPALVEAVLADADGEPGSLPLVAHVLRETWSRQPGDELRLADYRSAGGVREAVARTAERLYQDLDPAQGRLVRSVFLRLTALGEGTEDTRRRLDRDELTGLGDPGELDEILDRLAAARLVVVDRDTVEVVHEALIQAWPRLRGWLADDREALYRHRRLTVAAVEWDGHGCREEFLFRGGRLAVWEGQDAEALNEVERAFLAAGRAREAGERAAARRRVRRGFAGLGVTAVVVSVLAVLALIQADRNADARDRAYSRQLAAEARRQLALDPSLALLLATRAYEAEPTAEAESALRQTVVDARVRAERATGLSNAGGLTAAPDRRSFAVWGGGRAPGSTVQLWRWDGTSLTRNGADIEPGAAVTGAAFSADGRRLALGAGDGTIGVWELSGTPRRTRLLRLGGFGTTAVAFAPDGRLAGALGRDLRVWNPDQTRELERVKAPGYLESLAFDPGGTRLATGGLGLPIRLWDASGPRLKGLQEAAGGSPRRVAFAPDGAWAASAEADGGSLWRLRGWPSRGEWKAQARLRGHGGYVEDVEFSADGTRLATYADDRTVRVWTTGSVLDPLLLRIPSGATKGVAFAPDGRALAGIANDGTLRVWDVQVGTAAPPGRPGIEDVSISADGRYTAALTVRGDRVVVRDATRGAAPVLDRRVGAREATAMVLSPDGRRVATAGSGPVRVWDLVRGGEPVVVDRRPRLGATLAFSADGGTLAVGDGDGPKVWRVSGQGPPVEIALPKGPAGGLWNGGLAFAPDGRRLAAGRADGTVGIWDLASRERPRVLRGGRKPSADLVFGPDGRLLAGAAADGTVLIWDVAGGGAITTVLRGEGGDILHGRWLSFSPDARWLAITDQAGGLRLWRTGGGPDPLVVGGLGTAAGPLAWRGNSLVASLLGAVGREGAGRWPPPAHLRTWTCEVCVPGGRLLALARDRATRALTAEERRVYLTRSE
ncbi:hypothetical protein [Spirillospora sp. CA-294931]|uniref:nSTAND1 domain-containing NTPase n=1 Tax=Spirillospora sp. CA-294931 TaxID=3240042 RepID=UPI003D94952B